MALAAWPIFGGTVPNARYGINVTDDVLVNQTADGVNLNAVWDEFRDLQLADNEQVTLTDLVSFKTTATAEAVPQKCRDTLV